MLLEPDDLARNIRLSASLAEGVVESLHERQAPSDNAAYELLDSLGPVLGSLRGRSRWVA